jgi:mono/diheme cytochrome c family protein
MNTYRIKLITIILFTASLMLLTVFRAPSTTSAASLVEDPAVTYKAKCAACHLPTAGKYYDPSKPDTHHVEVILNGKKGEKPPFMPGYAAKGMTEDEAKGLAAYMRTLKPAN